MSESPLSRRKRLQRTEGRPAACPAAGREPAHAAQRAAGWRSVSAICGQRLVGRRLLVERLRRAASPRPACRGSRPSGGACRSGRSRSARPPAPPRPAPASSAGWPLNSSSISSPSSRMPSIAGQVLPCARLPMISKTCCRRSTWPWVSSLCFSNAAFSSSACAPRAIFGSAFRILPLGVVDVLEPVVEQVVEGLLGHDSRSSLLGLCGENAAALRAFPQPPGEARRERRGAGVVDLGEEHVGHLEARGRAGSAASAAATSSGQSAPLEAERRQHRVRGVGQERPAQHRVEPDQVQAEAGDRRGAVAVGLDRGPGGRGLQVLVARRPRSPRSSCAALRNSIASMCAS